MTGPTLEALDAHRRAIAVLWWFSFLSGPLWVALLAALIRRSRRTRDLRWVVDAQGGAQ